MAADEELVIDSDAPSAEGAANYSEENIITLEWNEHIRRRPGMYIG